ncbi:unnamed protein product [Soboliphyme baturini]|uniref:Reverse transcriptase domain-containing protein n=1 Tax=Soboliphyme baturini TaxID=241478 RepID=A0A183IXB7_9BILA|nr:unnamed protein product [Soboliphyme baturini]
MRWWPVPDDVVLLASSETDLQCSLERFAAECNVAGMRVNVPSAEVPVMPPSPVEKRKSNGTGWEVHVLPGRVCWRWKMGRGD